MYIYWYSFVATQYLHHRRSHRYHLLASKYLRSQEASGRLFSGGNVSVQPAGAGGNEEKKEDEEGEISTFGLRRPELSFGISRRRDDGFRGRSQPAGRERIVRCPPSLSFFLPPVLCSGQFRRLYEAIERDRHIAKSTHRYIYELRKREFRPVFRIYFDRSDWIRETEDTRG